MDREKIIKEWEAVLSRDPLDIPWDLIDETLAMLKEKDNLKRKWMKCIAENQLANAPRDKDEFMSLEEHLEREYHRGIYDGLQMAWEIITEET